MWILTLCIVFINIVMFFSIKRESAYKENQLFLVFIPQWAHDSIEIQEIIKHYNKRQLLTSILALISYLPLYLLPSPWVNGYFFIAIWINVSIIYVPFKRARKQLLELKKLRGWPNGKTQTIKIDLSLSAYMEKHPFDLKRYLIILFVDIFVLAVMIYYRADQQMYLYMILQFIVLFGGITLIKRIPNKTFCNNSEANITINKLRLDSFHHCFFFLIFADAIFNLFLQLVMLDKLPFTILLGLIIILFICIFITINKANNYQTKKKEILNYYNQKEYTISNDDCWKIGLTGPQYYNKADPRTIVDAPNGTQIMFNAAKPAYKYFIIGIWTFVIALLLGIFGYPYYLDITNRLVDLSIYDNQIIVDSPLYNTKISLENVTKTELTNDLGQGIRTNGTDAIVYAKGNYSYDKYGECKVYLASLHECYIILYTDDITYIINDDNKKNTKKIYQEIQEVLNNDN